VKISEVLQGKYYKTIGSCCLCVFCYYHILSYSLGSFFINIWLYSGLILQFMYFYWKRLCILIVVYVFHVFLSLFMYSYCCLCILGRGYPDWGFSVLFPQLWGKCQGITSQDGARPPLSQIVVQFYVLFVLCRSVYCLCVNVHCTTATGCQPNFS
jgi:hypothetical protein